MLEVSARFRRYSLNNQLLLWAQGTPRGMDPHPGRRVRQVAEAGLSGAGGGKGLRIFGPVTRRLRADEVASWLAQRRDPFDPADIGGVGRGRDPEGAQIRRHHPG
jgi:hypothetical protein